MFKYLNVFLFLVLSTIGNTQTAMQLFENAKNAYENSLYSEAIDYLSSCEKTLGATNPKIESLRSYTYHAKNDIENAYLSTQRYFQMYNGKFDNSQAHQDLITLQSNLKFILEKRDDEQKEVLEKKRMDEANEEIEFIESLTLTKLEKLKRESESKLYDIYIKTDKQSELKQYVKLFGTTNLSSKIKSKSDYLEYMEYAMYYFQEENYKRALELYQKAYNIYKIDSVYTKIKLTTEELDYQNISKSNLLEDYDTYYKKYPNGKYIETVSNSIVKYYLDQTQEHIRFKKYRSISTELLEAQRYLPKANISYKSKYFNCQLDAAQAMERNGNMIKTDIEYFDLVKKYYQNYDDYLTVKDPNVQKHIQKLNRQYRRIHSHGNSYAVFGYRADKVAYVGFDIGLLRHRSIGFMLTARVNPHVIESDANGNGKVYYLGYTTAKYMTGYANYAMTFKLFHPIWMYVGGGISSFAKVYESMPGSEDSYHVLTTKNIISPNIEAGIMIGLKPINLSIGFSRPVFLEKQKVILDIKSSMLIPNISIGYIWK